MKTFINLHLRLSTKVGTDGLQEVLLTARTRADNRKSYGHSGITVDKRYFIEGTNGGIDMETLSRKRLATPDVRYHQEQNEALVKLLDFVKGRLKDMELTKECVPRLIDEYYHPEKYHKEKKVVVKKKTFFELAEQFLAQKKASYYYDRNFKVLMRSVARYEGYIRATERGMKHYVFDVEKVTKDDILDLRDYLRNEKELSEEKPKLFEELLRSYPANLITYRNKIEGRGENAVIKLMKKLKSFFLWLAEEGFIANRPFDGVKIGTEQAGTPIYITKEERDQIATAKMPKEQLEVQRDIFIFQCLVGCRVSDLYKLTKKNITGRMLTYTPHKTKNEGEQPFVARVPLIDEALALIKKYDNGQTDDRLFPFITQQKYNYAIKDVFKYAGVTRNVDVRNALTGEMETKPINEVASSHMARRTFIGNLYFRVQDPNLIGQMSGHVEGSHAFQRYRKIEDETLMSVIEFLK